MHSWCWLVKTRLMVRGWPIFQETEINGLTMSKISPTGDTNLHRTIQREIILTKIYSWLDTWKIRGKIVTPKLRESRNAVTNCINFIQPTFSKPPHPASFKNQSTEERDIESTQIKVTGLYCLPLAYLDNYTLLEAADSCVCVPGRSKN